MKKLCSIFMTIILVLPLGFLGATYVNAIDEPTIMVSTVSGLPDNTVDVPIIISNNPGIAAISFDISYDSSKLSLINAIDGRILGTSTATFGNDTSLIPYTLCWDDLSSYNNTGNGTVAILKFKILSGATGSATISISLNQGSTFNVDLENVEFRTINGAINIASPSVTNIAVKTNPTKTTYLVGEAFDTNGLTLTATYNDGTTQTISSGFTCTPEIFDEAGAQVVTVSYESKIAFINVVVEEHEHSYTVLHFEEPTCETDGFTTYICNVCGDSYTETVYALGHTHGEWEINANATCTENGEKIRKCVNCATVLETVEIPATSHTQGSWVILIEPSCIEEGEKNAHCTSCGIVVANEVVPATGHTAGEWEVVTNSSCTSVGEKVKKCVVCKEILETEEIAMTEHVAGSWITVLEPTTEAEGKKVKKCAVCDVVLEESVIEKLPEDPEINVSFEIRRPSTTTISYGDSIILHADINDELPTGYTVEWTASNGNFSYKADGATCTISPAKSGDTTFTATIYDANGNAVSTDEQTMTSKAGFFNKIIAFFKKLFGLTKTYPDIFGI